MLVRLAAVTTAELLLVEVWRCLAAKELVAAYDAGDAERPRSGAAASKRSTRAAKRPRTRR